MAGRAKPFALDIQVDGARETVAAFRNLPKEASGELRTAALAISGMLVGKVQAAGRAEGRQAALLVGTVKAKRDRIPSITIGGTKQVGHLWPGAGSAPAYKLLFGSEFGALSGHGFKPHGGRSGFWIFPTVEANQVEIAGEWLKAADRIIEAFTKDGPRG